MVFYDKLYSFLSIFFFTFFGSIIPLFINSYYHSKNFNLAVGFSGGVLLSGGLIHLLPEALEDLENVKKKKNVNFDYPLCEIFLMIGIFIIIIVEQISDYLIQRSKNGKNEIEINENEPNINTCCNKCYNIFVYANKFDYINFFHFIKNNEFDENKMYLTNLKYYNFNSDDNNNNIDDTNNFVELNLLEKKTAEQRAQIEIKDCDSSTINSKYKNINIKNNKDVLLKLNNIEEKKENDYNENIYVIQSDFINKNIKNIKYNSINENDKKYYDISKCNGNEIDNIDNSICNHTHNDQNNVVYFFKTKQNEQSIKYQKHLYNNAPILLLAFSFHSIIEGITLGTVKNTFLITMSIISHKAFVAISIGVNLLNTMNKKKYLLFMFFFSLMTPLGILLGLLFNSFSNTSVYSFHYLPSILTSIGSGTFIYISLFEIIGPLLYTYKIHNHCTHYKHNFNCYKIQYKIQIILMILSGALLMLLLSIYL